MTKIYCDNCGKVLGENDYAFKQLELPYVVITLDLCSSCYENLNNDLEQLVNKYKKGGGKNGRND